MGKTPRSFSLDEGLVELLAQREDLNASAVVNAFLREYLASGQGLEAAMAVRKEQLEDELDEARGRVRRLEDELERVNKELEKRISNRRDVFEAFEQLDGVDLDPNNPAVRRQAEKVGLPPVEFLSKYREWAGIEA